MSESVIFKAAVKLAPERRAAYLDQACADPALRNEVESLLRAHDKSSGFLKGQPDRSEATIATDFVAERPGALVGPYKLMEQIGEGGMGLVFVAEQQAPVRRRVALKIIKPGMDTREVIARFEAERQALAIMDHPNIARVFDAGTTASGRPFFVMELVKGVPIVEYCDQQQLTARERLELFLSVCQAVQHAHGKGIIHRDLKPSNILVAPHDGHPVVKVIDFGVAKAIGQQLTDKTIYTRFTQMIGTPLYMSPEQAEVNQLDVDIRSDVYSLGVLLYELLTGTTPITRERFATAAFDEIRRIIREEEPPRPSTRLSTLGATLASVSARRKTEPAKLSALLRGELDWIVMKALEKDRTRRYETASGLARDVQRYLADEPIEARPASVLYRLQKTYRRNRAALTIIAAFLLLLLAGFGLVTWKWFDERAARADADAARQDAEYTAKKIQADAERMNEATAAMDLAGQQAMLAEWRTAEKSHSRAIELRPDHSQVWLARGDYYARMGLWDLATSDYAQSFKLRPPDKMIHWFDYALLLLWQGDEAGYRRVCGEMAERFGDSPQSYVRSHLARSCGLIPGVVPDYDARLGQVELRGVPRSVLWAGLYARGIAHYRAGRFPAAVDDFRQALSSTNYQARAVIYPVLAMTLFASGQAEAAREELQNSRTELDRWSRIALRPNNHELVPWQHWHDWVEFQWWHNEAQKHIEQTPAPKDPREFLLRGRALFALERTAAAATEFERAVKLAPSDYTTRLEAFRFHVAARQWPAAESELTVLKSIRSNDPYVSVEAFRSFAASGNWIRAEAEHAVAVKLRPEDSNLLLERFRYHAERGETAEAEAAFAKVVKGRAADTPFRIKLANACAGLKLWAKARDEYAYILDAGVLGDGEMNREAWLRLAVLQLYLGDVDDYRRTCARLVERHGQDSDWRNLVALTRICVLDADPGVAPDRVAELLPRITGGDPQMGLHVAAVISLRQGKDDADVPALQAARNRFQWDTQRIGLARIHHARGDYMNARKLLNLVKAENRKVDPTAGSGASWESNMETQLWFRQAEGLIHSERWNAVEELIKQRQWATAIEALRPLLTPENKSGYDWGTRANCFCELGHWQEALADSAHANSLAPDYLPGVIKHAKVCLRAGDKERYLTLCQRALESPGGDANFNNVAWLCTLDAAAEGEAPRALALIDRALDKQNNNTYVHTRACLLYRVGRYEDAREALDTLVAQPGYPVNAYDWLFLSMTHQRLGDSHQARVNLEKSLAWLNSNKYQDWERRAELALFRAEAERLIGSAP